MIIEDVEDPAAQVPHFEALEAVDEVDKPVSLQGS